MKSNPLPPQNCSSFLRPLAPHPFLSSASPNRSRLQRYGKWQPRILWSGILIRLPPPNPPTPKALATPAKNPKGGVYPPTPSLMPLTPFTLIFPKPTPEPQFPSPVRQGTTPYPPQSSRGGHPPYGKISGGGVGR